MMINLAARGRRALALILAVCSSAAIAADDAAVPEAEPAQVNFGPQLQTMLASPADFDYATVWQDFVARADVGSSDQAYGVLTAFDNPFAPTDAECEAHAEGLLEGLRAVPVSLALHLSAGACSDGEEQALAHVQAIRGLIAAIERPWAGRIQLQPYRVFSRWDAEALVFAQGYEVLNRSLGIGNYLDLMPMAYLVNGGEGEPNRLIYIDYFDTQARMVERDGLTAHPMYRSLSMVELAASGIQPGQPIDVATRALDAIVLLEGGELTAAQARTAILEVRQSDHSATAIWIDRCMRSNDRVNCHGDDVDLLLDDAETGSPIALAVLSVMHLKGYLVERDVERALGFYQHLRGIHDPAQATVLTTVFLASLGVSVTEGGALLDQVVADLEGLVEQDPFALAGLATMAARGHSQALKVGSPADLMERAYAAGYGPAGLAASGRMALHDETRAEAITRLQKIVENWDMPNASYVLASALIGEGREAEALPLIAQGARAMHLPSLSLYALEYLRAGHSAELAEMGRALLELAWNLGDSDSLVALVQSYADRPVEDHTGLEAVLSALKKAADDSDETRPKLVYGQALVLGSMGEKQVKQGLRYIRKAQRSGSAEAYLYEHRLLVDGHLGKSTVKARTKLLQRALKADDSAVMKARVGNDWYSDPDVDTKDLERAHALLIQAHEAGVVWVLNETAWTLCTEGYGDRGLPLAQRTVQDRPRSASIDTLAACYAATGDFSAAVTEQERALSAARAESANDVDMLAGMQRRLDAYAAGRAKFD